MPTPRIAVSSLALLLAAGCGDTREIEAGSGTVVSIPGGATVTVETCTTCHGDPARSTANADPLVQVAPPRVASGDPASPAIGAHLAHLKDGPLHRAVACASCHVIPSAPGGHPAQRVTFSGLAVKSGPATWDPASASCSATYCHGNLGGGIGAGSASPAWTSTAALGCNACHGQGTGAAAQPPATTSTGKLHPQNANCGGCHPGYTSTSVQAATHVDGAVEVAALGCTSCHGDAGRAGSDANNQPLAPAPPTDSTGATTSAAVGAHLRHLLPPDPSGAGGPRFSRPVACAECHAVPTAAPAGGSDPHGNGVADVAFGPLAGMAWTGLPAINPTWDPAVGCSATYCHGNFPNGNAGNQPITWTSTGTALCGSCHGFPPLTLAQGGTHPASSACSACHPPLTNGFPDPATHLDGILQRH